MGLEHEAVQTEVEGTLGNLLEISTVSSHVARVGKERQFRETGPEFHGNLPARGIAVSHFLGCRESPVNHAQFLDTGLVETLEGSNPQVEVRVDRILHEHRHVRILQCISDFLHQERIGRGAGTYPYHVHSELEAVEDVLLAGNLRGDFHPELVLHSLEPFQARSADTLEIVRVSAGLPYTRSEDIDSQ